MAWRICYTETVNGRLCVVMHYKLDPAEEMYLDADYFDWYTGYVQILPDDGIDAEDYMDYDMVIEAPGGLTFGGKLPEFGDKEFLGFDTNHYGMEDSTMADVINAFAPMMRDIEKVRASHD